MATLILLVAMFALLWLLLIRPQRRKQQEQQNLLSSVEPGDEVLTVGGLYGIVQEIDDEDDLVVEIAEGIHVRIARRAIAGVVKPDEDEEDEAEEADEDEADEPADAADEADGEDRVNDSEEIVSEAETEDTAAVDRR